MLKNLLNRTATVQRKTMTVENTGERTLAWNNVGTYPCRRSKGGNQSEKDTYTENTDNYLFFFEAGTDIRRGDRFEFLNQIYNISSIYNVDDSTKEHHIQVSAYIKDYE